MITKKISFLCALLSANNFFAIDGVKPVEKVNSTIQESLNGCSPASYQELLDCFKSSSCLHCNTYRVKLVEQQVHIDKILAQLQEEQQKKKPYIVISGVASTVVAAAGMFGAVGFFLGILGKEIKKRFEPY